MQQNAYADNVNPNSYKYMAFALWTLFAIFLMITVCFFGRIKLAVAILKVT